MPLFHIEEQRAPPPVDVPATTEAPEGGDGPGPTAENFQPLLLAPSMLP